MSELATFTFHSDPGHAWLEVTMAQLVDVGLEPSSFSPYSYYQRWGGQDIFYLEGDQDAAVFVGAYLNKHGKTPGIRELHTDLDHHIRRMASIAESGWKVTA